MHFRQKITQPFIRIAKTQQDGSKHEHTKECSTWLSTTKKFQRTILTKNTYLTDATVIGTFLLVVWHFILDYVLQNSNVRYIQKIPVNWNTQVLIWFVTIKQLLQLSEIKLMIIFDRVLEILTQISEICCIYTILINRISQNYVNT